MFRIAAYAVPFASQFVLSSETCNIPPEPPEASTVMFTLSSFVPGSVNTISSGTVTGSTFRVTVNVSFVATKLPVPPKLAGREA